MHPSVKISILNQEWRKLTLDYFFAIALSANSHSQRSQDPTVIVQTFLTQQGESAHTLVLTVKTQKMEGFCSQILKPNLVLKVLNYSTRHQFLINKNKNRSKFLFTFPHPSQDRTSVWANSPWASSLMIKVTDPTLEICRYSKAYTLAEEQLHLSTHKHQWRTFWPFAILGGSRSCNNPMVYLTLKMQIEPVSSFAMTCYM